MRSPRSQMYVKVTVIVLLGALEVLLVTISSIRDIKEINSDIAEQIQLANDLLARGQTINKLNSDIEKITPFLEKFDTIFIEPENQLAFIISLEELAEKQGVTAELSLADLPKDSKTETVSVPLTMLVSASFPELVSLLVELQKLNYYINIKTISLQSGTGGAGADLTSVLRSITYWQSPEK